MRTRLTAIDYEAIKGGLRPRPRIVTAEALIESLHPHEPPDDPRYPVPWILSRWREWFDGQPVCLAVEEITIMADHASFYLAVPVPPPRGYRHPPSGAGGVDTGLHWKRWWKRVRCYLAFFNAASLDREHLAQVEAFDPLPFFDAEHMLHPIHFSSP